MSAGNWVYSKRKQVARCNLIEFVSNGLGEFENELQNILERLEGLAPFMNLTDIVKHIAKET